MQGVLLENNTAVAAIHKYLGQGVDVGSSSEKQILFNKNSNEHIYTCRWKTGHFF
jgi:hypothetical protein